MLECLLCLSLAPYISTYESTIRTEPGVQVSLGYPVYVFGAYESPDLKIVGQHIPSTVWGVGLGYSVELTDNVSIFLEGGYYMPNTNPKDVVEAEVVNRVLRNDHGVPSFRATHFEYELEDGYGGRIGLDLALSKHLSVFAAYRFLKFNENFHMCTVPEACAWPAPEGEKHWANRDTRSYSSVQIGFQLAIGRSR